MVPLRPARRFLLLGVCLFATLAQAAPESVPRAAEADTDFLEFLGSWHNEDGCWMDPFQESDDLLSEAPSGSKAERPDPGARARRQPKGVEPSQSPDKPREPMRVQTGP